MEIQEIKKHLGIARVFAHYGLEIKKGHVYCPFHADKTPSMKVYEARPQLLVYETDKLLVTGGSSRSLRGLFKSVLDKAKKELPALINLEHWRSSVIVHWLQHQPLLEVQEMLGHRFASSTERYQLQAVQSLQEALEKYHPLA